MKLISLANNQEPKYIQLTESIRQNIRKGRLVSGDMLPTVKAISDDLKINRHTVMKAFAELIAEGWVESQERVGYMVATALPIETSEHKCNATQLQEPFKFKFVRLGPKRSKISATTYPFNFAGGQPDLSNFPFTEFKRCMSATLARPNLDQLSYGETEGVGALIQQVKIYLRKSRAITNREVLITNGSQEALFISAQLLLQSGDQVAVETLGYPPAMSVFKNAGAELVGVKQDSLGIIPEDLALKIRNGNIRLIYLTPLHQYPTTVTLPVSRRLAVYRLAAKHKIPIIEDDYDHEFHYRCQPLAPMASDDPHQLIIYISSFSKIMFPGARIGILAVNKNLANAMIDYRMMICHKSDVLMQTALAKWMENGGFERHLRRTTRTNMARRDHAVKYLQEYNFFEFMCPDGGMALWVKITNSSVNTTKLAIAAKALGVYIQTESSYHVEPHTNHNNYIRIGYAGMPETLFRKGIDIIVGLLRNDLVSISESNN